MGAEESIGEDPWWREPSGVSCGAKGGLSDIRKIGDGIGGELDLLEVAF